MNDTTISNEKIKKGITKYFFFKLIKINKKATHVVNTFLNLFYVQISNLQVYNL